MDDWQDRDLAELLREAQKVYVRREDESQKRQVKMMVAAVRESRRVEEEQKRVTRNREGDKGKTATVIGAKGEPFEAQIIKGVVVESGTKVRMGDFLLVPEADYNLLGRDLIVELGVQIEVVEKELKIRLCSLRLEDEEKINPEVWYNPGTVGKLNITPFTVKIRNPEIPVRIKQYPISLEGRRGLKPEVERLLNQGLLEPCMLPFNTPILPVKKADGSYRLVHDLREINKQTVARFPVVANPYTLLSKLGPENEWYSVIDLKDAFWACPLDESSRDYFAFEWEDPDTGRRQQLRWAVLPQGFKESPNLFGQALEQILQDYKTDPEVKLVQYVDDLLIADGVTYGVLTQDWAGKKKPIAYLSKILDPVQPGDWVLIRSWKEDSITPKWDGPYLVLITTDSARIQPSSPFIGSSDLKKNRDLGKGRATLNIKVLE
ncbi:uncharacterized protein LOC144247008 [Lonchura striata]